MQAASPTTFAHLRRLHDASGCARLMTITLLACGTNLIDIIRRGRTSILARSWLSGDISLGIELGAATAMPDREKARRAIADSFILTVFDTAGMFRGSIAGLRAES